MEFNDVKAGQKVVLARVNKDKYRGLNAIVVRPIKTRQTVLVELDVGDVGEDADEDCARYEAYPASLDLLPIITAATCNPLNAWNEYDFAAEWCAKRGISGETGSELPRNLSIEAFKLINDDIDAFVERVRGTTYALAMEGVQAEQ